jgi:hypothetical protein
MSYVFPYSAFPDMMQIPKRSVIFLQSTPSNNANTRRKDKLDAKTEYGRKEGQEYCRLDPSANNFSVRAINNGNTTDEAYERKENERDGCLVGKVFRILSTKLMGCVVSILLFR